MNHTKLKLIPLRKYHCDLDGTLEEILIEWKWTFERSIDWQTVIFRVKNENELVLTKAGYFLYPYIHLAYDKSLAKLEVSFKPTYPLVLLFSILAFSLLDIFSGNISIIVSFPIFIILCVLWYVNFIKDIARKFELELNQLFSRKNINIMPL